MRKNVYRRRGNTRPRGKENYYLPGKACPWGKLGKNYTRSLTAGEKRKKTTGYI